MNHLAAASATGEQSPVLFFARSHPTVPCCSCSQQQSAAIITARTSLLTELRRVAQEWQSLLSTLALQLLQVPRDQWHRVAAVQGMVANLSAERDAVVAFLHTIMDEVGRCCCGCCRCGLLQMLHLR